LENKFMKVFVDILGWLYTVVAFLLGAFSINMISLMLIFWIRKLLRKKQYQSSGALPVSLPIVTVQLPIYNEKAVAERLLDAVAVFNYPRNCLEIQVLDDSTDETVCIVEDRVTHWREKGSWIEIIHRPDRKEFKAGALRYGLDRARGEYIAIFDADFLPSPDWLKKTLPPFFEPEGDELAFVQTRWDHLNEEVSLLTRAQGLALDGHFGIDQNVRHRAGLMMNFNGTAGIWRKGAILDAGNWRGSTLSEDLDLSFRAQIKGWKVRYLVDVTAPAELPTLMTGFKKQQFRWAKGSIQAARLLVPELIRSDKTLLAKLHSLMHITGFFSHPLMLLFLLLTLPLNYWGASIVNKLPLGWMGILGLGMPLFYFTSQIAIGRKRPLLTWISRLPLVLMLYVGIAVNNTRAVLEAFSKETGVFERTVKTGSLNRSTGKAHGERIQFDPTAWLEVILGLYAFTTCVVAVRFQNWIGAVIYFVYMLGFGWVAIASIREARATMTHSERLPADDR
jgi:cellulose synthase/poly-beta-1,6-N-acetylglucosamine synthase-like glycosyltransferase